MTHRVPLNSSFGIFVTERGFAPMLHMDYFTADAHHWIDMIIKLFIFILFAVLYI